VSVQHELVCREFVELLLQYLAGELPPEQVEVVNRHLGECPSCVAYMKTYQQAVKLGREAMKADEPAEAPSDLTAHLVQALLASRKP
jgi:anti-sigma factor RsiW